MAAASSNHSPVAILHTTNRAIKYNLAAVVSELTHRHKAHRETGNMRDLGYREGGSRQMSRAGVTKAMVPLIGGQNCGMTVSGRCGG